MFDSDRNRTTSVKPLTDRQAEVLALIRRHIENRGVPPTRSELARDLGLSSAASVVGHLVALERKNYIEILHDTQRGLRVLSPATVPILDTVYTCADGEPLLTDTRIVASLPEIISGAFNPYPEFFFVLGQNAPNLSGLNPGVIIAVHKTSRIPGYDFSLIRLDNNILCRKLRRLGHGTLELISNDAQGDPHHDRVDEATAHIEGVVVGSLTGATAAGFSEVAQQLTR